MTQIHVVPHDDRWAVHEDPASPPIAEFETREAAELDARARAGESGAEVVVQQAADPHPDRDEPDLPGDETGGAPQTDPTDIRTGAPRGSEDPRTPQGGL